MTRNAIVKLLGAVAVAFLLSVAMAWRLHAEAPPYTVADRVGGPPAQATITGTAALSPTVTITPTVPPTPSETPSPSPSPTATPTVAPSETPTPTPTPPPPTAAPTEAPPPATPTPSATATPSPSGWFHLSAGESVWLLLLCLVVPGGALLLALVWWLQGRRPPSDKGTRPVPPPPPRGPYLESIGTDRPRRLYPSPQGSIVGRAPGGEGIDLLITQEFPNWETVSRRHARIYRCGGDWAVEDLNSLNGVYVNGRRTGHNLLRDGWQVDIGGVQFVFRTGTGRRDDEVS